MKLLIISFLLCVSLQASEIFNNVEALKLENRLLGSYSVRSNATFGEVVSPNGKYLAISVVNETNRLAQGKIGIFSLNDLKVKAIITGKNGPDVNLVPSDFRWGPANKLYVRLRYQDIGYGEWFLYDFENKDFKVTDDLKRLIFMKKDQRPAAWSVSPKVWPGPPVWDTSGKFYINHEAAEKASVKNLWENQLLLNQGVSQTGFWKDKNYMKFFIDQDVNAHGNYNVFLFHTGVLVQGKGLDPLSEPKYLSKIETCLPSIPTNGFFLPTKNGFSFFIFENLKIKRINFEDSKLLAFYEIPDGKILLKVEGKDKVHFLLL